MLLTGLIISGCGKSGNQNPTPVDPVTPVKTLTYTVSTFSGNNTQGSSNGDPSHTSYFSPYALTQDASGNFYVADFNNNLIRKVTSAGISSVFAGNGSLATKEGTGTIASIFHPVAITIDSKSNLFVADLVGHIVKITPAGVLTFFAGSGAGAKDGLGLAAQFNSPGGLVTDARDNIFVADDNNNTIRKITPAGLVSTFAGSATNQGKTDGTGTTASFSNPVGITIDASGNLYVSDISSNLIRKITPAAVVTTVAGSGAQGFSNSDALHSTFNYPSSLAVDADGNIFVADFSNHVIREISAKGIVTTFAGYINFPGYKDGPAASASFDDPNGIIINAKGEFYIADKGNNVIRKIDKE